jgi:hypothetical protein
MVSIIFSVCSNINCIVFLARFHHWTT